MSNNNDGMTNYLASHPRMIGALFTLMLLLGQAGAAAAGSSASQVGP